MLPGEITTYAFRKVALFFRRSLCILPNDAALLLTLRNLPLNYTKSCISKTIISEIYKYLGKKGTNPKHHLKYQLRLLVSGKME